MCGRVAALCLLSLLFSARAEDAKDYKEYVSVFDVAKTGEYKNGSPKRHILLFGAGGEAPAAAWSTLMMTSNSVNKEGLILFDEGTLAVGEQCTKDPNAPSSEMCVKGLVCSTDDEATHHVLDARCRESAGGEEGSSHERSVELRKGGFRFFWVDVTDDANAEVLDRFGIRPRDFPHGSGGIALRCAVFPPNKDMVVYRPVEGRGLCEGTSCRAVRRSPTPPEGEFVLMDPEVKRAVADLISAAVFRTAVVEEGIDGEDEAGAVERGSPRKIGL